MTRHEPSPESAETRALRTDDLGTALRRLPMASAPSTLAPRVMAAVRARLSAPVARTWFDWPVAAQVSSVLGFLILVAAAALVWPGVENALARTFDLEGLRVVTVVARTVWHPVVSWFLMIVTMLGLLCATCGVLLGRVALGGASR